MTDAEVARECYGCSLDEAMAEGQNRFTFLMMTTTDPDSAFNQMLISTMSDVQELIAQGKYTMARQSLNCIKLWIFRRAAIVVLKP